MVNFNMTDFTKYNISNDEVWEKISKVLSENANFYKKVRIKCVAFKNNENGDYQNILCVINAITAESYVTNQIKNYGQIFLFEYWYDIKHFNEHFNSGTWINILLPKVKTKISIS